MTIPSIRTEQFINKVKSVLEWQNNIILEGVPGVGKTWIVEKLWKELEIDTDHTRTVTFGPASEPEEFIGGLFPQSEGTFPPNFKYIPGVLMELAELANADSTNDYYIFIDEINRANLPKVMGALMTIIETSKRYKPTEFSKACEAQPLTVSAKKEYRVSLPHEEGNSIYFGLPDNLYIVGAMNTSDRSVIHLDSALRRRFSFLRINTLLSKNGLEYLAKSLIKADSKGFWNEASLEKCSELFDHFVALNEELLKIIGPDGVLGHSYFFDAAWCKNPDEMFKQKCKTNTVDLTESEADFMDKIFSSPIDSSKITTSSFRQYFENNLPRDIIDSLIEKNILKVIKENNPKTYSVKDNFDISNEVKYAFWQGFWDQYIYAILPQLADTFNAFAIDEDKTVVIFEHINNITDIFVAQHSDLEAQRRKLTPPPEQGAAREWRVE